MRRCLIGDLTTAAAVLSAAAPQDRARLADRLLAEAHAAHLYAKRFAKPHPSWGNGSLMARALANFPKPAHSPDFAALTEILTALARFRTRTAE
jgi:hypothetical protein